MLRALVRFAPLLVLCACAALRPMRAEVPEGFEVFSASVTGAGWVIHHHETQGDSLWACPEVASAESCRQVLFDAWRTGATLRFLHVDQDALAGWLLLGVPGDGDVLYACYNPVGSPRCEPVTLEARPPGAILARVWPAPPAGDVRGDVHPAVEASSRGRLWIEAGPRGMGPVNFYACVGLLGTPQCALAVPNWLVFDREPWGLKRTEDLAEGGVRVLRVEPGSPAASALKEGAVVRQVAGFSVRDTRHLQAILSQVPAESPVRLTLDDGAEVVLIARRRSATRR